MNIRVKPIGDLVEPVETWNPSARPEALFPYVDLSAVDQAEKKITGASQVRGGVAPSRARQLVRCGDVLISTVRPNLNGVAPVTEEFDGATASTGFCVLRPNVDKLDSRYLMNWVRSPAFVEGMVREATGASYPAVSDRVVKASHIPLPPLDEQRRIAAILDKADALRRKRKRALDLLDGLTQSIFLEMFGNPIRNPKGLTKVPLGEVIKIKSGDGLVSKAMAEKGSYPVYGGNGINGYHDQFMFSEQKLVIGRVGVYCGAIHLTEPNSWVTDNALYVSELKMPLSLVYLKTSLSVANLNQYADRAAQPLVSGGRIYPIEILLPSHAQQEVFEAAIKRTAAALKAQQAANFVLSSLFASLQHRAFSGQL